jgi:cytochrome bd-type quinol oxidase subunit 2
MLLWLESQSTAVIVLLVFAICYALGAIVFFAVKTISRRPIAEQLNATTPVMLTPLAVIAGLLIAFLASRVWSNLDRATALCGAGGERDPSVCPAL